MKTYEQLLEQRDILLYSLDHDLGWACQVHEMPKMYKQKLDQLKIENNALRQVILEAMNVLKKDCAFGR